MPRTTTAPTATRRALTSLTLSNLLGGVGVASGFAVGGRLIERAGGTAAAGVGQAAGVLGAGLVAVPLARLAAARGRRWSLGIGYAVAVVGAGVILWGAAWNNLPILLAGLALFGVAQATNLQSRYAATDHVDPNRRGRAMSLVIWATTVGTVLGPNLTDPGDRIGAHLGLPTLAGPYLFSLIGFALAGLVIIVAHPRFRSDDVAARIRGVRPVGALAALRWAGRNPTARTGVVAVAGGHAIMVAVMVMTPLHMQHHGMTLKLVGLVISLHTLGMYALSPVFGWLTDRVGPVRTAWVGVALFVGALGLGFAVAGGDTGPLTAAALFLLGLGWSATTLAGSAMIAATPDPAVRVPLQGAADATMSDAGAAAAAVAGPVLALGGFEAINALGAVGLVVVLAALARHR
jgi:MFS family permease